MTLDLAWLSAAISGATSVNKQDLYDTLLNVPSKAYSFVEAAVTENAMPANLNNALTGGWYYAFSGTRTNGPTTPTGGSVDWLLRVFRYSGVYTYQFLYAMTTSGILYSWTRYNNNGSWSAWVPTSALGQQTIDMPAVSMTPRTTNGATPGSFETTTNKVMVETLDFDPSTEQFAQWTIRMPKGWNGGTLILQPEWSHPATATNFGVVWGFSAVALANDDPLDSAFGTEVTSTDTGGTTDDFYTGPETAAMTVAGSPGAEELVVFQVSRKVLNGSDTMGVAARLRGVKIHYTIDAARDD